jgi:hypothetical protein
LEEVRDGEWREIHDLFFPKKIFDDYEYARPVRSSSYAGHAHVKSFERDKKEMEHVRLGAMFQDSNEPLIPYLMNGEPLILAGAERDMSIFRQVSAHTNQVISQVNGNYQFAHQELFKDKVLHAIHEHQHALMQQSVSSFLEKWGSGLARCGLQDCWQAVEQGQGLQLLVERGYRESMYLSLAGSFSKENIGKSARFIPDAIDELMETTLLKGGSVMFVDNNMLSSAQRVALTLRYT